MIYKIDRLHINYKAREWCRLPYPDHPNGCPNYGKRSSCPPQAPLIEDHFGLSKDLWIVSREFDLAKHEAKMLSLHPLWSRRQCRCVLYWQGRLNSDLLLETRYWVEHEGTGNAFTLCPEAMGVNVITTARSVGVPILTHPEDKVFKVSLIGYRND